MAWQQVQYTLTSSCPMIQHNGQTADALNKFSKAMKAITSKRKKTDSDLEELSRIEFMAGLYMDADGPIIPSYVLDGMIINAAKKNREGPLAKSGCFSGGNSSLQYDGPRTGEQLFLDEQFRFSAIVRVGTARVVRMRPIFPKWTAVVMFNYEDSVINRSRLDDWLHIAGTQVGIGDWRPQYGRFEVALLD